MREYSVGRNVRTVVGSAAGFILLVDEEDLAVSPNRLDEGPD
jgi:hypothetical protein